jgi:hypothetical protein
MSNVAGQLLNFMTKWSGKSGGLILVNVLKKLTIKDVNDMTLDEKGSLLDALTREYLSTFLGHSRFLMARAELVSILEIPLDSYVINDMGYRRTPQSPDLMGKPRA